MTFASVHEASQHWVKGREFTNLNTTLSGSKEDADADVKSKVFEAI
jgi:hypothetical protein